MEKIVESFDIYSIRVLEICNRIHEWEDNIWRHDSCERSRIVQRHISLDLET